jgi:hypothetical protein
MRNVTKNWFSVLAGTMLILAIPVIWPYSYFQILRWVVMSVAIYNAFLAYESKANVWVFIMGSIAILFNPISPIYFKKETWVMLDLITSVLMFISIVKIKNENEK